MTTLQSQFKTIVQSEMNRLRALTIPPVQTTRQSYSGSFQNATLVLRQIKHNKGGFFRVLRFMSFF